MVHRYGAHCSSIYGRYLQRFICMRRYTELTRAICRPHARLHSTSTCAYMCKCSASHVHVRGHIRVGRGRSIHLCTSMYSSVYIHRGASSVYPIEREMERDGKFPSPQARRSLSLPIPRLSPRSLPLLSQTTRPTSLSSFSGCVSATFVSM